MKLTWQNTSPELLELLDGEWKQNKNINSFLIAIFNEKYPVFEKKISVKGGANEQNYVLKKSLYDRLINKVMTTTHTSTGKKILAKNLVDSVLDKKAEEYKISNPAHLLILMLVKAVPNYTIRRLKFGSGHLTRATRLTIGRKITWFLCALTQVFKQRKVKFSVAFGNEIDYIMSNSPKSKILALKKEALSSAEKANIQ